jgi:hypothetical protein
MALAAPVSRAVMLTTATTQLPSRARAGAAKLASARRMPRMAVSLQRSAVAACACGCKGMSRNEGDILGHKQPPPLRSWRLFAASDASDSKPEDEDNEGSWDMTPEEEAANCPWGYSAAAIRTSTSCCASPARRSPDRRL